MSKMFDALRKAQDRVGVGGSELIRRAEETSSAVETWEPPFKTPERIDPEPEPVVEPPAPAYAPVTLEEGIFESLEGTGEHELRALEQYRLIRARLLNHPRRQQIMVVTSPGPRDGKTTTSVNLAGVFALRERLRVLLVDADLRRSSLANTLGIEAKSGLANVLAGEVGIAEAILQTEEHSNLHVLPAGNAGQNPAELFESSRWIEACDYFRKNFDVILVDTPPIGVVAEAESLLKTADGVVMVVRMNHTDRTILDQTLNAIPKEKLLGIIVNCAYDWLLWKTNTYQYYYRHPEKKVKSKG